MPGKVVGLSELARSLRRAEHFLAEQTVRDGFSGAAALVRATAAARAAATGRRADAVLAGSYRVEGASVSVGDGARLGDEFGAGHGKQRQRKSGTYLGYNQFPRYVDGGRFLYPSIEDKSAEFVERIADIVERLFA